MVACVLEDGWTIEATAERFQVDAKTVRKWRDRFIAEGDRRVVRSFVAAASVTESDSAMRCDAGCCISVASTVGERITSLTSSASPRRRCGAILRAGDAPAGSW